MEKIYKREEYLKKIRGFYNDDMIKVISGIRRCGKSYLLKSIISELEESGVNSKDIIYIELDKKEYVNIDTPLKLEKLIDSKIIDKDFKYLFIDEVQNVKNYEKVINAYREENMSIFLTGSNSYLLSGELMTKLTGRYIEVEMLPLNFYEYVDMKKFLNKEINSNIYLEFEEYIRCGGFPKSLFYDNIEDKMLYTTSVINQIFEGLKIALSWINSWVRFFLFVSKSIYFYDYIWYDCYGGNMIISKGRGYVYGIEYNVVFCTKYHKKIITGSVKDSLFQIIISLSQEMDFKIIEINTDLDHIHLLISCKPQHYIPTIVKRLKGTSARLLFKLYPELKKELYGGHMWNPSYFVTTVSDTLEDNIKEYISNQGK